MSKLSETTIRIDPTLSTLLRPLWPEELEGLEADILRDGCIDPLIVWDKVLVDGHHRYAICRKHGIRFRVKQIVFASLGKACLWLWNHQQHRRNTTVFDRGERLLQCKELVLAIKAKAKDRQRKHGNTAPGKSRTLVLKSAQVFKTRQELARMAGVGHDTLGKIQTIVEHADEATKERLRRGEKGLSVNATYKDIRKAEQRDAKAQAKAAVPADLPAVSDRYRVIEADIARIGNQVADNSVDWIITDPPYPKEYLGLYAELSVFASRTLKPGGSLICMVGQSFLPEVMKGLGKHMTYHWTLALQLPGATTQVWQRKILCRWKPLLWFVKGEYSGDWIDDVCKSDRPDKEHHEWGQSESGMTDIIERFTFPGQTICDPFCGGGTTGVVALRLNRLFIGIDNDPEAVVTTLERLVANA